MVATRIGSVLAAALVASLVLSGPAFPATKCSDCPRDTRGRIARDSKAVRAFKAATPQPEGCNSCEVDHIIPLSRGGADDPSNMQWLPRDVHREKTRGEGR